MAGSRPEDLLSTEILRLYSLLSLQNNPVRETELFKVSWVALATA
jgi:hypothetical protein